MRCLLCCLVVGWWTALLSVRAIEITQGPLVQSTPTNAVIRWSTDRATGTRLHYGIELRHLESRIDTGMVSGDHAVTLGGLKPGTTYWYTVGTSRLPLLTNSFTPPGGSDSRLKEVALVATEKSPAPVAKRNARPTPEPAAAFDAGNVKVPPASDTWGAPRSLQDHFERHGADFSAKSPDDYAAKAWIFLRRATAEGLPAKLDEEGVLRVYEPKTKTFASYNRNLTTKTFFKPGRPDYFDAQPGKSVDLKKIVK